MNITILTTRDLEKDLEFLRGFLCEKIANHLKKDQQSFSLKVVIAEKNLLKRGAQAKKEFEEGSLLAVSISTGEALRNLRNLGCQSFVDTHKVFMIGGKEDRRTLKLASCKEETVLWPKKEPQKLVTRQTWRERTERLPYKDD